MPQRKASNAKRPRNYEYLYLSYEEQPFDPNEYIDNLAMIKKLHEEKKIAHASSVHWQVRDCKRIR